MFVNDEDSASSGIRALVDDPAAALVELAEDLRQWEELTRRPDFAVEFVRATGMTGDQLRFVAFHLNERIQRLKSGREQAERIREITSRYAVRNLKAYLHENPPTAECLFWLMAQARTTAIKKAASNAATSKNADPRQFVSTTWAQRTDKGQSKASFARMLAPLVKLKFGVSVTPDRIARYWLLSR